MNIIALTLLAPLAFVNLQYMLMVALPGMLLSSGAAWLVKSRFAKYSKVPSQRGYTGQQAAQALLDAAGIQDVQVVRVDGSLTDHYNPCLLYTSPSPRDGLLSRMPSSA